MNRFFMSIAPLAVLLAGLAFPLNGLAEELLKVIDLPTPQKTGGKPLMEALAARQTIREISSEKLSKQTLSNLMWAAFGVNRPSAPNGKIGRTAPSAMNLQEVDIYVALAYGAYIYDPVAHKLKLVIEGDIRAKANNKKEIGAAPIQLIYVENTDKKAAPPPGAAPKGPIPSFAEVDIGFIGQNVYLFCASEGLAAWFYVADREGLAAALKLKPSQRVLFGQAVGHPTKK